MLHAVIMAGGAGTRFWPASRKLYPKQLLKLVGERTMIQATVDRLAGLVEEDQVMVLTNRVLIPAIRDQLPELPSSAFVGEPCKRDTAPCIGLAAVMVCQRDEDATMLVMPADHVISPDEQFHAVVREACQLVDEQPQRIVTFGIRPTYPAEAFGYVEKGDPLSGDEETGDAITVYHVKMFREKPEAEVAEQYLASGNFYWNSGIFVWKAKTIIDAIRQFEPDMYRRLDTIAKSLETASFGQTLEQEFAAIEGKSIDYAVMEKYDDVVVIDVPFNWDDVGSWRSLARMRETDDHGNTVDAKHLGLKTRGCIIRGTDDHLVVTVGLDDCIIVHTPDATLVARKHDEEAIRQVVDLINEQEWDKYL